MSAPGTLFQLRLIWLAEAPTALRPVGAGGTVGALLTGLFATSAINDGLKDPSGKVLPLGWVDGNPGQVLNQAIGCAIAWALAIVGTFIILKICDVVTGLRVEQDQERGGLDVSQHGEEGYFMEM